ncbi:hypothetical protein L2E82_13248 [Cichorium intybus]|uniref:Uncharacterized protein n=1 Tax=Cichorium intybus TaxID=13427 RepID=A0ACB9GIC8_CICIN|nr:hypothetical protein L2E82_13248 [Cichorium intybus]
MSSREKEYEEFEEFDIACELSTRVSNVLEMSHGGLKVEAVDGTNSKESQSIDYIALESLPFQDVPVLGEYEYVGSKGK